MIKCRGCDDGLPASELDEDGLCEFCIDTLSSCPRCKAIYSHDELCRNSAFIEDTYPSCNGCLTPEEKAKKAEDE